MKKSLFGIIRIRDQLAGLIVLVGHCMSRSIHTPEHAALRDLLIAARKAAGLTQEEVAKRLDRPQSFVAKYEGGERRIDVVEFVAVAQALEQDPRTLFATLVQAIG
ncbi:MAG TPA: helix-turn-helix transcriptional regulator [Devosia sp.]|jgi:DNA-binding transcriptional regulator YiaG|uniref:helix-turn-helix domain-containing protein n=1 Tax=Devosia sp. TaxID=1871048 RepID=UPI002DDD3372|nr:helix-turn-helix transcriptional regulator [Devosia sp.]HEV2515798.1 helix-turn-helix transcriptional regulator [Devosia sp.]